MTEEQLKSKLERMMELGEGSLTQDSNLESIEAWDSMAKMDLLSFFDQELKFNPPAGALEDCRSVGDVVQLVKDKLD